MRQRNRDRTGAATEIEQPADAVESKMLAQNADERRRIHGTIARVVPRGPFVNSQIVLVAFAHGRECVICAIREGCV